MSIGPAAAIAADTYLLNAENANSNWPNGAEWRVAPGSFYGGQAAVYYDRLDRWYLSSNGGANDYMWIDPLLQVSAQPTTGYEESGVNQIFLTLGEHNPATNVQNVYTSSGSGQEPMTLLDVSDFSDTGVWSHHASAQFMNINAGITPGTAGYKNTANGAVVILESWGYYLQLNANVVHSDLVQYDNVFCRVSLTTGLAELMAPDNTSGFVTTYKDTPHQFELGRKNGHAFTFGRLQFIPDISDANYNAATPKGVLFMATRDTVGEVVGGNNLRVGSFARVYVKMVEFNPEGVVAPIGGVNRVHGREILFTRYALRENSTASNGIGANVTYNGEMPWFHSPSNTLIQAFRDSVTGDNRYVSVPLAIIFDALSKPTAIGSVTTGKTVVFRTEATGNLGEKIASQDVSWGLKRISSFDEALDTVGLPATSTVDNPAIDAGTLVVERLGVPLTDGLDYTVVESTGVITWAGSHPDLEAGYTASYEHINTPATPAHGVLRTTLSSTDTNGVAEARVEYADDSDLVLEKDQIEALAV